MIVIVEGIDRVGKTTLCNKLNKKFNVPIHKYSGLVPYQYMDNTEETDKTLGLFQLLSETNASIIFDRTYMSDFVYGCIERDYEAKTAMLNEILADTNASNLRDVFLVLIEPTDIERSSKEHGKDLSYHKELFDKLFNESKIKNKLKCDYNTIDDTIEKIRSILDSIYNV